MAIPGKEVVQKWIDYFPKAIPAAKPEIITMLGIRGDEAALASGNCFTVRSESECKKRSC